MRNSTTSEGLSTSTVVFIVFLILKLIHVIDWSWWWITSPLWIPLGLFLLVTLVVGIVALIFSRFLANYRGVENESVCCEGSRRVAKRALMSG